MLKFCQLLGKKVFLSTNLSTVKVDKDLERITNLIRSCPIPYIDV